jgi:hypothetical protein
VPKFTLYSRGTPKTYKLQRGRQSGGRELSEKKKEKVDEVSDVRSVNTITRPSVQKEKGPLIKNEALPAAIQGVFICICARLQKPTSLYPGLYEVLLHFLLVRSLHRLSLIVCQCPSQRRGISDT